MTQKDDLNDGCPRLPELVGWNVGAKLLPSPEYEAVLAGRMAKSFRSVFFSVVFLPVEETTVPPDLPSRISYLSLVPLKTQDRNKDIMRMIPFMTSTWANIGISVEFSDWNNALFHISDSIDLRIRILSKCAASTEIRQYATVCMRRPFNRSPTCGSSHPAVFRLMNAGQANDVGNMYENSLHTFGNAVTGHENPVRNIAIGEMNSRATSTVSRLWKNELQAVAKKTQSVT